MSDDDRAYFHDRAEAEIRAAQTARHPDAARAHYRLAGFYLDLAHNGEAVGPRFATTIENRHATA